MRQLSRRYAFIHHMNPSVLLVFHPFQIQVKSVSLPPLNYQFATEQQFLQVNHQMKWGLPRVHCYVSLPEATALPGRDQVEIRKVADKASDARHRIWCWYLKME